MSTLRVLFATSEVYPLSKTGGLADVSYSLPRALAAQGVDVRLLIPGYPAVLDQLLLIEVYENILVFPNSTPVRILAGIMPGGVNPVYVIDCPSLYVRDGGPYLDEQGNEWPDNALRFAALSKVAALFGNHVFLFKPHVVHCNDWQTGLAPAYMNYHPSLSRAKSLMSVHNIAYQGVFGLEVAELFGLPPTNMQRVVQLLGLPLESFGVEGLEYHSKLSFLKAGLHYADWLTTVSPTYAKDVQTAAFGYGLQGLLTARQSSLSGILNGIDTEAWDPKTDSHLAKNYSIEHLPAKGENTKALRAKLGLEQSSRKPLLGMITRLTYQKGLDLLVPVIPDIIQAGAQLVLLGSGDKELESRLLQYAKLSPSQISVNLGYNEALAHQIEAGADIFLMPSLFEPCGLNQMYSMRYGTIPIVRRTGGLADTVIDAHPANLEKGIATGFVFEEEDAHQLLECVYQAVTLFRNREIWRTLQINGMSRDFSWQSSAKEYCALYRRLSQS